VAANTFLAQAQALSEEVTALRATDASGNPAMNLIANIPFSVLSGWANALISAAAAYETLELTVLPAECYDYPNNGKRPAHRHARAGKGICGDAGAGSSGV
jgi:hypothetical protein